MKPTGGGPQVTPIPPPTPLFPNATNAAEVEGYASGKSGLTTLGSIAKGGNFQKLVDSIVNANQFYLKEGQAAVEEAAGGSGMRFSTDLLRNISDFRLQSQKDLTAQLGSLALQEQGQQLGAAGVLSGNLMQLATSFAPNSVVTQSPAGPSPFSQLSSAGEAAMSLFLMASMV